jgi:hypothetical protein
VNENRRSAKLGKQTTGVTHRRFWRSRIGLLVAAVAISVPIALVSGSAPALAAAQVVNGPAEVVTGTAVLNGIACHGHDNCVAVGSNSSGEGVVVPITDGIPGTAEVVPGSEDLTSVSCPTSTSCLAAGYGPYTLPPNRMATEGVVVGINDGVPGGINAVIGSGQIGVPDSVFLYGVGCLNANKCYVGGSDYYLAGVVARIRPDNVGNEVPVYANSIGALACEKPSFCVTVGQALSGGPDQPLSAKYGGAVIFISYGKTTYEGSPSGVAGLTSVSCRSTQWCLTGGVDGHGTEGIVELIVSKALRVAQEVPGTTSINGVACRPTTIDCLAVGGNSSNQGVVAGVYGGTPGTARAVKGTTGLSGVACPTNTLCLVVGSDFGAGVLAKIHLPPR